MNGLSFMIQVVHDPDESERTPLEFEEGLLVAI